MKKFNYSHNIFSKLTKKKSKDVTPCFNDLQTPQVFNAEEEGILLPPSSDSTDNSLSAKHGSIVCKIIASVSALVLICSTVFAASEMKEASEIYDNILRLHVIANSDSVGDQELKLKVRDAVLSELNAVMGEAENLDQAEQAAKENAAVLVDAAKRVIFENGYSEKIRIDFVKEYYPTREYEEVKLPAGIYSSVKIIIGEGNGKNWWCVLFPSLCTKAAQPTETFQQVGFTPGQIKVLTESENPKYVLKFRFLEVIGDFTGKLFKNN